MSASCRCGAEWGGYSRCHCSRCHRTFSGLTYFDAHQRNNKCLDPLAINRKDGTPLMRLDNGIYRSAEDYDSDFSK